jgi:cytochrome c-type biogenesis protein CcmH
VVKLPLWLRYLLVALVLLGALVVGSKVFDSTPPTSAQRVAALETTLKCPSCQDLSVAQSSSPSSLAVRRQVTADVAKGMSDDEIVSQLRAQYGNAVLLTPPPGGLSLILWLVPLALALSAASTIVVVMRRRAVSRIG